MVWGMVWGIVWGDGLGEILVLPLLRTASVLPLRRMTQHATRATVVRDICLDSVNRVGVAI